MGFPPIAHGRPADGDEGGQPLLIQWGNIDKSFGPNQQKEAARKVMQMGVSFLVSSEAVKRASGTVVDPATGMPGANIAGSDSFRLGLWARPDLKQLYTPDEWQGVVRDARRRSPLMAAGKEMGYRAVYAAASTQVQNNLAALDGAPMQAKLAFVTTGDATGLQSLLQKARGMRLGLTGEQQARAMGQLQGQVADVAYSVLSNPNKMAAIDYANRIAGGEKIQLPDGAVGQDAALFVKPRFGVGDPTQANPDGWAAYYGSTGRLTDLDKQIFGTVSYATDPEKLAAISSNFAAMHEKDPKISEQIDGKAAELLMDFNRFVVQGNGDLKEWQSLHKDALKMDQTERAAQTARIAITGYNDAPARAAELTTGLRQALDQTGVISSMWRGIFGGNLPTSAELVPDVNRQNVMGLVLSFMPNGVNMALGGRPIDVPIVITAGAQQSYNVQWTTAVHRAGPRPRPARRSTRWRWARSAFRPSPCRTPARRSTPLPLSDPGRAGSGLPSRHGPIAGQLAHDLASNEKIHPSMLAEGSAPATAVDWKTEVLAGRVRLEPVLTGNGSAVSGYRVSWYADPARDPIPMEVGGKLWKYDGHPTGDYAKELAQAAATASGQAKSAVTAILGESLATTPLPGLGNRTPQDIGQDVLVPPLSFLNWGGEVVGRDAQGFDQWLGVTADRVKRAIGVPADLTQPPSPILDERRPPVARRRPDGLGQSGGAVSLGLPPAMDATQRLWAGLRCATRPPRPSCAGRQRRHPDDRARAHARARLSRLPEGSRLQPLLDPQVHGYEDVLPFLASLAPADDTANRLKIVQRMRMDTLRLDGRGAAAGFGALAGSLMDPTMLIGLGEVKAIGQTLLGAGARPPSSAKPGAWRSRRR